MRLSCCGELAVAPLGGPGPGTVWGWQPSLGGDTKPGKLYCKLLPSLHLGPRGVGWDWVRLHKLYRCFVTFEWQCVPSALCINPLPCLEEKLWPHLANSSSSEVMRHHEPGRGLLYNEVMITWARKLNYTEIWIISFSHIPTPHHAHLPNSSNAKYLRSLVSGFWKLPWVWNKFLN